MNKKFWIIGIILLVAGLILFALRAYGQEQKNQIFLPIAMGDAETVQAAVGGTLKGTPPTCDGGHWYVPQILPGGWNYATYSGITGLTTGGDLQITSVDDIPGN